MSTRRLLLAEDDFPLRQSLSEFLSECGFEVDEAEDGDHAAVMLEGFVKYDLLITDIDMPGRLDGNALASRAKAKYPRIPVIYASGYPQSLTNKVEINDAFVAKPFGGAEVAKLCIYLLAICHENYGSPAVGGYMIR